MDPKPPWSEEGEEAESREQIARWCDKFSSWKGRSLSLAWHQAPGTCPLCTFCGNLGSRYLCSRVRSSPPCPCDLCTPLS